jgi:putative membrane protein
MSLRGVTAHGDPRGTLQFFRLEVALGRHNATSTFAEGDYAFPIEFTMRTITKLLIGAAGGLAGAALMGQTHKLTSKLVNAPPMRGEDATEKVANNVAKKITGRRLRSSTRKTGGHIVHYAFGAAMGSLYVVLADATPLVSAGRGALFGAAIYAGAHAATVPALGLASGPLENDAARECAELSSHVVYGVVTDTVYRLLAR